MAIKNGYKFRFILLVSVIFTFGCSKKPEEADTGKVPAVKEIKGGTLTLFNWEEYIGSNTLENFKEETGIQVNEINFYDEEGMLGAVQSDLAAFDLVIAIDDTVREMREAKLLAQLDYSTIPNFKYIDKKYRNMPCDPEQKFTIPYLTGTTGMVVNKKYIKEDTDSWKVLFDKKYEGRLAMLNDSFEVVAVACKLLGYSINTTDRTELAKAKDILLEQKPLLQGYYADHTIQELLTD